jgi:hypothetical protein
LVVACSLGAGPGDEHYDINAGPAYPDGEDLESRRLELVAAAGTVIDALAHHLDGWPDDTLRIAAKYENGVQLDLAVFAARWHRGRHSDIPIIDKDRDLADPYVAPPEVLAARLQHQTREWTMLRWWAFADAAKYLAERQVGPSLTRMGSAASSARSAVMLLDDLGQSAQ